MASLASCLKKAGKAVSAADAAEIRRLRKEIRAEGLNPARAAERAVDEYIESMQADRLALIDQIEAAGGDTSGVQRPAIVQSAAPAVELGPVNPEGRPAAPVNELDQGIPHDASQEEKYRIAQFMAEENTDMMEPIFAQIGDTLGIEMQSEIKSRESAIEAANEGAIVNQQRAWWNLEYERDIFQARVVVDDLGQVETVLAMLDQALMPHGGLQIVDSTVNAEQIRFNVGFPNGQIGQLEAVLPEEIDADTLGNIEARAGSIASRNAATVVEPETPEIETAPETPAASSEASIPAVQVMAGEIGRVAWAARALPIERGSPEKMLKAIESYSGIRAGDIEATGLERFVVDRDGDVSRADVIEFLSSRAEESPATEPEGEAPELLRQPAEARTGEAARQAQLRIALAPAIRSLMGRVRVNIVQATTELPGEAHPADVEGMWYVGTDEVYLVADNLHTVSRAKKVMAHETFGHLAMEEQPEFADILASIRNLKNLGNVAINAAAGRVAATQGVLNSVTETKEILAVMVEDGVQSGMINRAIAAVRQMLRRLNLISDYSEGEIRELIVRAARGLDEQAAAKRAALANMPVQEQLLSDPRTVEHVIYNAIEDVYAIAALQDATLQMHGELNQLASSNDPASLERANELRQALYRSGIARQDDNLIDPAALYAEKLPGAAGPADNVPAATDKTPADILTSNAENLRELAISNPAVIKDFGSVDVETRADMLSMVRGLLDDPEIGEAVVRLLPVDVMNMLGGEKFAPNVLLDNPSMLVDLLPADANDLVPSRVEAMNVLTPYMAGATAKRPLIGADLAALSDEDLSARGASEVNLHVTGKIPYPLEKDQPLFSRAISADPEIERLIATKMSTPLEDIRVKDRVRGLVERWRSIDWLSVKQGIVDSAASVGALEAGQFGGLLDASESAYKALLATKNLGSVMAAVMHVGIPVMRNGVFSARAGREGLLEIAQPIAHHSEGNLLAQWELYLAAYRANRLIREKNPDGTSREKNFTQADIDKALTLGVQYPEFVTARKKWQKFNSQLLDLAIKHGVINAEEAAIWRQNDYVPFYRAMEAIEYGEGQGPRPGHGVANVRSGIKRLTGAEAPLGNVFENMVMNTSYLVDAVFRNHAMQRIVAMADGVAMEKVPMAWEAIKIQDGDMARALMKAGLIVGQGVNEREMVNDGIRQVAAMTAEQKEHWSRVFRRVAPRGDDVVSVLQEGKPVYYRVDDPLLLRSIAAMGAQSFGGVMNTFRLAKRTLTGAVTIDPAFMMANFIRDTLSTWVVADHGAAPPFLKALKGAASAWTQDEDTLQLMMAGAGGGGFYDHNPGDVRKMLAKKMPKGKVDGFMNSVLTPRGAWRFWQKVGNASEQANRVAKFRQVVADGGTVAEGAYQARDVLNFSMSGDYEAMKFIVQTVPFLNARVQGLYRLARGAQENPVGFAMKGVMITAATMALLLRNQDNDDYEELPEWDKDTYWHFFIGDEHFRLPKPFEVGALFATIPERAYRLGTGDEGMDLFVERMWRMTMDTFAFNPVPQLVKPLLEQYANRNMFTGNPIIGLAHEGMEPEAQYDPWTSETMRELATTMPDWAPGWLRSPKRLQSATRGYFGAVGMYALGASDSITRRAFGHPDRPAKAIQDRPVITRFWRNPQPRTSKYSSQLYDMMHEADALHKTMNAYRDQGRIEEMQKLLADGRGKLETRKYLHSIAGEVRKINAEMRKVQYSTMSPDRKRVAIDRLNKAKIKALGQVAAVSDIF